MKATLICTPGYANWLLKFGEPRHPRSAHAWAFKKRALVGHTDAVKVTFEYRGILPLYGELGGT